MSLIGNVLWIVLGGGFVICLEYLTAALALGITIIGIPFAVQCVKLAVLSLLPFGREAVPSRSAAGCTSTIFNLLWIVTAGLVLCLTHLLLALICAVTIVGIPFAKQHMKLAGLALSPFGREIR